MTSNEWLVKRLPSVFLGIFILKMFGLFQKKGKTEKILKIVPSGKGVFTYGKVVDTKKLSPKTEDGIFLRKANIFQIRNSLKSWTTNTKNLKFVIRLWR